MQDLACCDYFSESQKNAGPDICKIVGDILTVMNRIAATWSLGVLTSFLNRFGCNARRGIRSRVRRFSSPILLRVSERRVLSSLVLYFLPICVSFRNSLPRAPAWPCAPADQRRLFREPRRHADQLFAHRARSTLHSGLTESKCRRDGSSSGPGVLPRNLHLCVLYPGCLSLHR